VSKDHIGNIIPAEAMLCQGTVECSISMEVIMTEKFFILLVADACIYQDQPVAIFNEKEPHGPVTKVVFIGRIDPAPDTFWNHTEHRASV
jgi:hypothetical protein